jgi:hypothetical protein
MSADPYKPAPAGGDDREVLLRAISLRIGSVGVAAVLAVIGAVFVRQAWFLDFGTLTQPGPGCVPLVLAALTFLLAILVGVHEWQQPDSGETVELGHRDVVITFAAMLAVPILFEWLGAYLTLGLFGAVLLIFIARTPVVTAAGAATAGMVACWYFFQVALGLQLPLGKVWEWLTQVNG